jgi:hypothetical protein
MTKITRIFKWLQRNAKRKENRNFTFSTIIQDECIKIPHLILAKGQEMIYYNTKGTIIHNSYKMTNFSLLKGTLVDTSKNLEDTRMWIHMNNKILYILQHKVNKIKILYKNNNSLYRVCLFRNYEV